MLSLQNSLKPTKFDKTPVLGYRPLFFAAVFMLFGILFSEAAAPPLYLSFGCAAVLLILFFFVRKRRYAVIAVFFALFFLIGGYFTLFTATPIKNFDEIGVCSVEGKVVKTSHDENKDSYLLSNVTVNGSKIGKNIFLYTSKTGYEEDDYITAEGRLMLPSRESFDGGFSFYKYCLSNGAAYSMISYDTGWIGKDDGLISHINDLRRSVSKNIDELLGEDSGIVKAFTVGIDDEIHEDLYDAYRQTGISHILVISGLHIGVLYLVISLLLALLRTRKTPRLIISLCSLSFFCALAGFSVSVLRASAFCAYFAIGQFLGKKCDALTGLSIPFIISILINPACIYSASLQMSYAAVFGILCMLSASKGRFKFLKEGIVRDSLFASLGATLGTLPMIINMNNEVYLPSVLINLFVVPFASVLIPYTFAAIIIYSVFGGVSSYLAVPSRLMIRALNGVSRLSEIFPFGKITLPSLPPTFIIFFFMLLFLLSGYVFADKKYKRISAGILAFGMILCFTVPSANYSKITILDTGSYDCAVVESGGECALIDAGGDDAVKYLKATGKRPNKIIITSADDRKIGSLAEAIELTGADVYSEKSVIDSLETNGFEINSAEKIIVGDVIIHLEENENGARLTASKNDIKTVFLEDNATILPNADIIKLYKRGRKQKYTLEDVKKSGVKIALISSGTKTSEETAALFEGRTIINTYDRGTIEINLDSGEVYTRYDS